MRAFDGDKIYEYSNCIDARVPQNRIISSFVSVASRYLTSEVDLIKSNLISCCTLQPISFACPSGFRRINPYDIGNKRFQGKMCAKFLPKDGFK
jgi:hypothetical protein